MSKIHTHDLLAYDGLKILQRDDLFKFSLDSLLLADFVKINPRNKNIIDLGCGLGPISMYLTLKTKAKIFGVDIQEDVIDLARESVKINHLEDQVTYINDDIRQVHKRFETNQFDIVICNPPFYKTTEIKQRNDLESLSLARHEVMLNLEDLFLASKRLLSNGGKFYLIHRAERLDEITLELNRQNFVIKRMRFVYTVKNKAAKMVLIEARHNGSLGSVQVEEPLMVYDELGQYTKEVLDIFHLGDDDYESS